MVVCYCLFGFRSLFLIVVPYHPYILVHHTPSHPPLPPHPQTTLPNPLHMWLFLSLPVHNIAQLSGVKGRMRAAGLCEMVVSAVQRQVGG